jgi:hypothetical protein
MAFQVDTFQSDTFQETIAATLLEIWRTSGGAYTDYSSWLYSLPVKTHALNQPQTLEFSLTSGIASFVAPEAGNRVRWTTAAYGVTFLGYCLNTPELTTLGADKTGAGVYGYKISCIDESVILEWNRSTVFPTLQPFVNQSQGAVVKGLIAALGGGFTTTNVDAGILIPYFRVKPEESFWDAVRRLSDRTNMKLWFLNGAANYKSYGDSTFSPAPNEADAAFNPYNLTVTPVDNPIFNDVIGVGNPEPQAFVREHFIGDGLTATFPLKLSPFGAQSSLLNVDDWTEAAIDATRWTETDVNSLISMNSGSLKFAGGPFATGSRLTAVQGLEIAGKLELRSGRFRFTGANNAILGGLFTADTGALADCVAGFRATPNGANTVLQPIVSGAVAGPTYQVVTGKSYNLVIVVDCSQAVRRRRPFFSLASSFGGENVTADARVSFYVLELVDGQPDSLTNTANTVISYTATIIGIQQFLFFTILSGPMNGTDVVNMVVNFTYLHAPIQCEVWTRPLGSSSWTRERLGDKAQPDVRAAVNATQQSAQVIFISGQEPAQSERVRVIYRGAGLARARVKKGTSITAEAAKAGDTGVRSGVLPSQQPVARDAPELERQIQAYIDDSTIPLYRGTWQFDSKLYSVGSIPVPGRMITVTATSRYAAFSGLVTAVKQAFACFDKNGTTEIFIFDIEFGPLSRLQDEQENFLPSEDAMSGPLDSVTTVLPVDTTNVGTVFSADVPDADFDLTLAPTTIEIDAGMNPTSSFEVRKTDSAWNSASTINQISTPATRTFLVPRTSNDIAVYLKNKDGSSNVSRYPALVRVVYPLPPNTPSATFDYSDVLNIKLKIDPSIMEDINTFGFEVRAKDNATVLKKFGDLVLSDSDLTINFTDIVNLSSDTVINVRNWDFEESASILPPSGWITVGSPTLSYETATQYSGIRSLKIVAGTTAWGVESLLITSAKQGDSIKISCLAKTLSGANARLQLIYRDSTGTAISVPALTTTSASWTPISVFGVAPPGTAYATIGLKVDPGTGTVYFDEVKALLTAGQYGIGCDAFLVSRTLDFYVYAWNLLGEYSPAYHVHDVIPTPIIFNLSVDETAGKLVWTITPSGVGGSEIVYASFSFSSASKFKVEVATDAGYTNIILTKLVSDRFLVLDDENMLRQRYFRVTPGDAIGWGAAVTASHVHTPASVVDSIGGGAVNNADNTYSLPAIPTPTTDITPDSAFSNWGDDIKNRAREIYALNLNY